MTRPFRFPFSGLCGLVVCGSLAAAGMVHGDDPAIDSPMYRDPVLPNRSINMLLPPGSVDLWLEALARPEVEFRYRAAQAFAAAHRQGLKGPEKAVPHLIETLSKPKQDATVRLALAQALIDLDARAAAPVLLKQAEAGTDGLRRVVEPALARWRYKPAGTAWLQRLDHPGEKWQGTLLAIRGLQAIRDTHAVPPLHKLVFASDVPAAVRVEAARALGTIQTTGAEADAQQLLTGGVHERTERLCAVCLLQQHRSPAAIRLLQASLHDEEPAVVRVALNRLLKLDPKLALPALSGLLANHDAEVRLGAIEVLFREMTQPRLTLLAQQCNDAHPQVRRQARRYLEKLAAHSEFRAPILKLATDLLHAADWRGQEQAALLLGQLDHKPAASRLVKLLESERPEVCLAAAWGLRKLAVPATLPRVLAYVRDVHRDVVSGDGSRPTRGAVLSVFDHQMSQLVQLLGRSHYQPADPVLRSFVPKMPHDRRPPISGEARTAAVWALGMLHEGKPDPTLARQFGQSLLAIFTPMGGDDERVLRMYSVALARMKATSAVPTLREFVQKCPMEPSSMRIAAIYAIEQLTGKPFPPDPQVDRFVGNWFLTPVKPAEAHTN